MKRTEAIEELLRRYPDARETLFAVSDLGDGTGLMLMPKAWDDSMRELERCLLMLRARYRNVYWHVKARYIDARLVITEVPVKNGKPILPGRHEVAAGAVETGAKSARLQLRRWDENVDKDKVTTGLNLLASWFVGEPCIYEDKPTKTRALA